MSSRGLAVWRQTQQLASHSLEDIVDPSFNSAAYCPIQPIHVNASGLDYSPRQAKVYLLMSHTEPDTVMCLIKPCANNTKINIIRF